MQLDSDNVIVLESDKSELSIEFADRAQENVFLNKEEVGKLIEALKLHQEKWRGENK